ncbi:sensor domain-containing protein [Paenibacillus tyrfis]|uniref:sensor domain-containing protein n=1 Tax=Paenibacillus tyrfis TaxID=1501230 RepID=UPI00068B6D95|nr:EAL domain-containing protein [Paenibacillus tyrfis]
MKALQVSEMMFKDLFQYANDAVFITRIEEEAEESNVLLEVNEVMCSMLEYSKEELLALKPQAIIKPMQDERLQDAQERPAASQEHKTEAWFLSKKQRKIPVEINSRVVKLNQSKVMLSIARDITERKEAESKIRQMLYYDELTNLPNRRLFISRLEAAIQRARHNNTMVGVLYLDVDGFKNVNDTLGHNYGDMVIRAIGGRLVDTLGIRPFPARIGGDEFTVFIPDLGSKEAAVRIASNLSQMWTAPFILDGQEFYLSSSIGIAFYPDDGEHPGEIMKRADRAMYYAKEGDGAPYRIFTQEMDQEFYKKIEMQNSLRKALQRNEFVLHYQPLVDATMETTSVIGAEALIRWNHPDWGMVSPGDFIPLAEETGLIVPIGEWVLKTACRQFKEWQQAGFPPITLKVNLSARQFKQPDLAGMIQRTLLETEFEPRYLGLEITEGAMMQNPEQTIATLNELKTTGIRVSVDDFGTGYSSLNYIRIFPIDIIKIDKSFIQDICKDDKDEVIISTIISMAHNLNLKVVAEGVETEEQLSFLQQERCDAVQGYYYSKPLPAQHFLHYFAGQSRNHE